MQPQVAHRLFRQQLPAVQSPSVQHVPGTHRATAAWLPPVPALPELAALEVLAPASAPASPAPVDVLLPVVTPLADDTLPDAPPTPDAPAPPAPVDVLLPVVTPLADDTLPDAPPTPELAAVDVVPVAVAPPLAALPEVAVRAPPAPERVVVPPVVGDRPHANTESIAEARAVSTSRPALDSTPRPLRGGPARAGRPSPPVGMVRGGG